MMCGLSVLIDNSKTSIRQEGDIVHDHAILPPVEMPAPS